MKKVIFIQLKAKSYGGIWQVNKIVAEELIHQGYDVTIVSIRENKNKEEPITHPKLRLLTINKKDVWENTYSGIDIYSELKKIHLIKFIKKINIRLKHEISVLKDMKKLHKCIDELNPDYIVTSHYQLLNMIPKKYLHITIHEQHCSLDASLSHKATNRILYKYSDKIKFIWMSKKTMEDAIKNGFKNSTYIYNAVRFKSENVSDVLTNKKLITIARFSKEKRIDLMIDIVKTVFENDHFKDWNLEIYGSGKNEDYLKDMIKGNKQIKLMGLTYNPKKELLTSSIYLNTSEFEGFPLSILEANECGVPTISFNFGESVNEEIINGKTGIIAIDKDDYIEKLKMLMENNQKLEELSINCKKFSNNFQIDNIIKKWIELFNEIDKQ